MFKTKKEISDWLYQQEIVDYTINDDLSVDVQGDVHFNILSFRQQKDGLEQEVPIKFNYIGGFFFIDSISFENYDFLPEKVQDAFKISNNNFSDKDMVNFPKEVLGGIKVTDTLITSLKGVPKRVYKDFYCGSNKLTSLQYAPEYIGGNFDCSNNQLTNLEYSPIAVLGRYDASNNKIDNIEGLDKVSVRESLILHHNLITSLKGCPNRCEKDLDISENKLMSLDFFPKYVGANINIAKNELKSLRGIISKVNGDLDCSLNKLITLEYAPKIINKSFRASSNVLENLIGMPHKVGESIELNSNKLTNLKGLPQNIKYDLNVAFNELENFNGIPSRINGSLIMKNNRLTSLEGCPIIIKKMLDVSNNMITSLNTSNTILKVKKMNLEYNKITDFTTNNTSELCEYRFSLSFVELKGIGKIYDDTFSPVLIVSKKELDLYNLSQKLSQELPHSGSVKKVKL